ncbi:MAG: methyltransferase domain-containing protein [Geminicoccaceae bacterium]|nr:methyltransferase domain-containing protein [Geminicoccaceae bacterium]
MPATKPPYAAVTRRYRGAGRFIHGYVACKLRMDPVHRDVLALAAKAPFGRVLDVGCGRAQLDLLLLEAGLAASALGLDVNAAALAAARTAGAGLPFEARMHDLALDAPLPKADTVLLIDVLYQLRAADQDALLAKATKAAGRTVVVRTFDPTQGLRSRFTRGLEVLGRRFWPTSGSHVQPRPIENAAAALERAGFAVRVRPCQEGTPFANVLLVGRRRDV